MTVHKICKVRLVGAVLWILAIHNTTTRSQSCVSSCACSNTVVCQTHLTSFPVGLPPNVTSITIMGAPTRLNKIPMLKSSDIQRFSHLENLYVSYSQVTQLENSLFQGATKLRRIKLMYNKITSISASVLQTANMLFVLDLTGNSGCTINVGAFEKLTKLVWLFLGGLGLGNINPNMFLALKSLRGLDLHGNSLYRLSPDTFKNLPNLRILDLSNNHLSTLGQTFLPVLSQLTSFDASDNQWRCTCDLGWFKQLPQKRLIVSRSEPVCSTPSHLKYRSIYRLPNKDLPCILPSILSCSGPHILHLGEKLSITCQVEGDLFPDILFVRPDGANIPIPSQLYSDVNYTTVRNVSVPVHSASSLDHGDWEIHAVNSQGKDEKTFHVEVIVPTTSTTTRATTTTMTRTTVVPLSPGLRDGFSLGFLIASGAFGATVLFGVIIFAATACCVKKKKRIEPQNNKNCIVRNTIDEMTFNVAPVSS